MSIYINYTPKGKIYQYVIIIFKSVKERAKTKKQASKNVLKSIIVGVMIIYYLLR